MIGSEIKSNEAELAVDIRAWIEWRLPPESTEQKMMREQANRVVADITHEFQEDIAKLLLSVILKKTAIKQK